MISCPKCNADTQVMETRQTQGHARRRRICKSTSCGVKFTTLETVVTGAIAEAGLVVVPRRKLDAIMKLLRAMLPADVPTGPPAVTITNPEESKEP